MCKYGYCGQYDDNDYTLKLVSPWGLRAAACNEAPDTFFAVASLSDPRSPIFGAPSVSHLLMFCKSSSFGEMLFSAYQKLFRTEIFGSHSY